MIMGRKIIQIPSVNRPQRRDTHRFQDKWFEVVVHFGPPVAKRDRFQHAALMNDVDMGMM